MLKPEQVPDEVARIADEAYYDTAGDNPTMSDEDVMKRAISAALNAWTGAAVCHYTIGDDEGYEMILPLPFPQEGGDE